MDGPASGSSRIGKREQTARSGPNSTSALEEELLRTRELLAAALGEARRAKAAASASAEEYQAINEELQTSNAELIDSNDLLRQLNSDIQNLIESTEIATLFLDGDLRIKAFTPAITAIFQLRDTDRGRPIAELASRLADRDLPADILAVLEKQSLVEREVRTIDYETTFIMRIRPYHTVDRTVDGLVLTFIDVTEHRRTEETLRQHAALVEFAQDALIGINRDGSVRSWNPGAERLFGYPAAAALGRPLAFRPVSDQADRQIARALAGEVAEPVEIAHRRLDGSPVEIELTVMPIRDADGAVVAVAATARNISNRKSAETMRTLLLHELSHRVKNALATVQSLAMETLRTSPTPAAFREAFVTRLMALSGTHDLLTRSEWQGAQLGDVLAAELAPYQGSGHTRWTATGPNLRLSPKMALAFGMAFHELATNAAKYGALSVPTGHVAVTWRSVAAGTGPRLKLSWVESGGPVVAKPLRKGFGSRLIADGLAFELDGEVEVDYDPAGVRCTVGAPLDGYRETA